MFQLIALESRVTARALYTDTLYSDRIHINNNIYYKYTLNYYLQQLYHINKIDNSLQ